MVSSDDLDFNFAKVDTATGLKLAVEAKHLSTNFDIDLLEPLYIRKSQAEEGR